MNCKLKAAAFNNNVFAAQCNAITDNSTLPQLTYLITARLNIMQIGDNDILTILKTLKTGGKLEVPDEISTELILLCGDTILPPLKIIFNNILVIGIFPDIWKAANVVLIRKKEDKQLLKNYRPISLLPIRAKIFEKLLFQHLYNYFHSNNLITEKQSWFQPGVYTTNQLIDLFNEIHCSLDNWSKRNRGTSPESLHNLPS